MIAWSWSRLSTFEICARLFLLKNITKSMPFIENEAMKRGKTIHNLLERAVKMTQRGEDPGGNTVIAPVMPIIQSFVKAHSYVDVEQKITFKRDLTSCTWYDRDAWFRTIIDVIGVQNGHASIIDWKTGRVNIKEDQLRVMILSVFLKWPEVHTVDASLVFVDQKQSSPLVRYTRDRFQLLLEEFEDRVEAIQIANERASWPPSPGRHCNYMGCPKAHCEHGR